MLILCSTEIQLVSPMELITNPLSANIADAPFPTTLPEIGLGGRATLDLLVPFVLSRASRRVDKTAIVHLDPPAPWMT